MFVSIVMRVSSLCRYVQYADDYLYEENCGMVAWVDKLKSCSPDIKGQGYPPATGSRRAIRTCKRLAGTARKVEIGPEESFSDRVKVIGK